MPSVNTYGDNRNYQELADQVDAIVKLAEKRLYKSYPVFIFGETSPRGKLPAGHWSHQWMSPMENVKW